MSLFSNQIVSNTLVDYPRLETLRTLVKVVSPITPGAVAEVGVYKGGTARLLCENTLKHVYLFDTFEGLPTVASVDLHHKGDFNNTSMEHVKEVLMPYHNYSMYKGVFPRENSEVIKDMKFSLVHIDVDIYDSVKECLEFFAPRMSVGGIIVLDDYNAPSCPGAKLASDDFAKANNLTVEPTVQCQAVIKF